MKCLIFRYIDLDMQIPVGKGSSHSLQVSCREQKVLRGAGGHKDAERDLTSACSHGACPGQLQIFSSVLTHLHFKDSERAPGLQGFRVHGIP